jgi:glycogen debranching enzyme
MATTWEGDARAVTIGLQQYFRNDVTIGLNLSRATLNQGGIIRAVTAEDGAATLQSVEEKKISLAELRIQHPVLGGQLDWLFSASDKAVVTTLEKNDRWTAGLQWTRKFEW